MQPQSGYRLTHPNLHSNVGSIVLKYAAEYRNTSEQKTPLPPHIFQFTNNACYHILRTTQDQSIFLSFLRFVFFFNPPILSHFQIPAENSTVADQRIDGWRSRLCSSSVSVIWARRAQNWSPRSLLQSLCSRVSATLVPSSIPIPRVSANTPSFSLSNVVVCRE